MLLIITSGGSKGTRLDDDDDDEKTLLKKAKGWESVHRMKVKPCLLLLPEICKRMPTQQVVSIANFIECAKYYLRVLSTTARFRGPRQQQRLLRGDIPISTFAHLTTCLSWHAAALNAGGSFAVAIPCNVLCLVGRWQIPALCAWIQIAVHLGIIPPNRILVKWLSGRC